MLVRLVISLCARVAALAHAVADDTDGLLPGYALTSWYNDAGRPLGSVYAMVHDRDRLGGTLTIVTSRDRRPSIDVHVSTPDSLLRKAIAS